MKTRRLSLLFAIGFYTLNTLGQKLAPFDPAQQPPAPDYSQEKYWSSLPFRTDAADIIPAGENWVSDSLKDVDVFYIYPTVYMHGPTWNEDVNDQKQNGIVDKKPVKYQASVFNASCRVYVPRYRQAIIRAFHDSINGPKALAFAYEDVKHAFQYYLEHYNHGRPFIIASHSQGTYHARRLLAEFFDSSDLKKRLVAAYVIGYGFNEKMYKNLKPCENALQTGCYITWASFKDGYEPGPSVLYGNVCVNPVSWSRDTIAIDKSKSIGGLLLNFNKEYKQACATQVHHGLLWVKTDIPIVRNFNIMHIADYNLFWYDIRKNVKDRINAYLGKAQTEK
jgi:hypothetical protein